jgi:beta-lactam-binding protein with PASTA domain
MTNSVGNKDIISFDRLYLTTSTEQIYDAGMKLKLDDEIYSINSLKDISDAMKINLGLKDSNMTKSFSFSINTPYEQPTIGKGSNYKVTFFPIVPDFTSKYTHQSAENWGANNNITIKFNTIDSSDSKYSNGQIIKQSIPAATLVDLVNKNTGITLTIINKINTTPTKLNCELSENENNSLCKVPDFKTISEVNTWTNSIIMNFMLTKTSTTTLDESLNGKVISQSVKAGTKVIDMPHELTIEYYKYSSDLTDSDD